MSVVTPKERTEEDGVTRILCTCGSEMRPETGRLLGLPPEPGDSHEWLWWRCSERSEHVTRALPLPVTMARG